MIMFVLSDVDVLRKGKVLVRGKERESVGCVRRGRAEVAPVDPAASLAVNARYVSKSNASRGT